MDIRIYQISRERDQHHVQFIGLEDLPKYQGKNMIDSSIYDAVYAGTVEAKTLEDVFRIFNISHPIEYHARSLSVSDVVEVITGNHQVQPGYYFCDHIGFSTISFDPEKAHQSVRLHSQQSHERKIASFSELVVRADHKRTVPGQKKEYHEQISPER